MKNDKYKQKTFIHWLAGQKVRLRSGREIGADKRFIRSLVREALDTEPNCWTNTTSHTTIRAELPWHVLERCAPNRSVLRTAVCKLKSQGLQHYHKSKLLAWNDDPAKCVVKKVESPEGAGACLLQLEWEDKAGKLREGWYESWQVWGLECVKMERAWRYYVLAKAAEERGFVKDTDVYHAGNPVRPFIVYHLRFSFSVFIYRFLFIVYSSLLPPSLPGCIGRESPTILKCISLLGHKGKFYVTQPKGC